MTILKLKIEFFSYWQCGTGRGEGVDYDGVVSRDDDGLPYVPGKTFKGIFKDALFRYLVLNGDKGEDANNTIKGIFGEETHEKKTESKNYRINSALLSSDDRAAITNNTDALKMYLYHSIQSTAINPETGGAESGALRVNEVAIPLRLETHIKYIGKDRDAIEDFKLFKNALPFFYIGIGGNRRRGLGRVKVTVADTAPDTAPDTAEAQNAA